MKFNFLFKKTRVKTIKSNNPKVKSMTFVTDETEKIMTFKEVIDECNAKQIWFADDWGHSSTQVSFDDAIKKMESRPSVVYYIMEGGSKITIFPQVKTEKELQRFADGVRSCGSLD